MSEKKFSPEEALKILRVCTWGGSCDECPLDGLGCGNYSNEVIAAEAIEELTAEVARLRGELILKNNELLKLREENRWIPTSERLPENDHSVLVIVSGRIGNIHLDRAIELAEFSMDEGWILEMWPEWENPTVTHWRPMPEVPREEGA